MMALSARSRPIPSHFVGWHGALPFESGRVHRSVPWCSEATVAEGPPGVDVDALHVLGMASADARGRILRHPDRATLLSWLEESTNAPIIGREERAELVRVCPGHNHGRPLVRSRVPLGTANAYLKTGWMLSRSAALRASARLACARLGVSPLSYIDRRQL